MDAFEKERYEGEWKDDHKNGKGVQETPEGRYEGEWKDGKRHGQGTFVSKAPLSISIALVLCVCLFAPACACG